MEVTDKIGKTPYNYTDRRKSCYICDEIKNRSRDDILPIAQYVRDMWETGRYSDLIIKVETQEFKVHKNILGVNSPVFGMMFTHDTKEKLEGEMEIVDFTADVIKELLTFIYTRDLPAYNVNAMDLYAAAAKYQIKELEQVCNKRVLGELSAENALAVFMLGYLHENTSMKIASFTIISRVVGSPLPQHLMNKPEKLKKLINAKMLMDEKIELAGLEISAARSDMNNFLHSLIEEEDATENIN